MVRARWQDRHDEANEQAAGSGYSQAASRDTSQGEIKSKGRTSPNRSGGAVLRSAPPHVRSAAQKVIVASFEQGDPPASHS